LIEISYFRFKNIRFEYWPVWISPCLSLWQSSCQCKY